ncbi:hypothetical protein [Mesorhizobium caraganae]
MTNEAVADLKLEKGKQAYAVIKARMSWSVSTEGTADQTAIGALIVASAK